jgi:ElaB/YqjD/DUF883 family membrane-anchored ribosome-binding protein
MSATTFPDKTKQAAGGVIESVKDEVKAVAHSVADVASNAKDKVRELADDAAQSTKQAADKVQKWAGDTYEVTSQAAGDFGREVTALVRKYPVPALLVGFGMGMLLGRVSRV